MEITVRRTDIIGDGYSVLHSIGAAIKGRLMVTFVSQHGVLEAGIDHGGLVKEFLEEVSSAGLLFAELGALLPAHVCHLWLSSWSALCESLAVRRLEHLLQRDATTKTYHYRQLCAVVACCFMYYSRSRQSTYKFQMPAFVSQHVALRV